MRIHEGTGAPKLVAPQCYMTQAEVWTGVILTLDGKRRDSRIGGDYILIFDNLAEAREYADRRVSEFPDVECHILDHSGQMLTRVVKRGHRRIMQRPKYQWWKFWRWTFRPK